MKTHPHFVGRGVATAMSLITSLVLFSSAQLSRADLVDGLLSYWDFEGNYEDSAGDFDGNASTVADDGTAGSAVAITAAGPLGNYGTFSRSALGIENVVAIPDSPDLVAAGENLSISAWFRVDAFNQTWQGLVAHGEGSDWRIARRGDESGMGYAGGIDDIPGANISPAVNDGMWHHVVAITESGVSTRLWVDGSLIATGGVPTLTDNGAGQMFIGGNPQGNTDDTNVNQYRPWNGGIDDVALWDRVLSDSEIGEIYDGGAANVSLGQILLEQGTDTDEDGMPDAWEIVNLGAGAELDDGSTNIDFGPSGDPDVDQSSNFQEFNRRTDPMDDDSDDDGYVDGVETDSGIWDGDTETGSDPLNPDSDGDGLVDGVENPDLPYVDANQTGSDPNLFDTDNDTYPDGVEVANNKDPNDEFDFPGSGGLPVIDDFEDNIFDDLIWLTNLVIPQGGAAVVEEGGHIRLTGRGHLYTREEFDPTGVGGIYIKGKWTYTGGDDFLQILTRSDALPAGEYGETQNGIEFQATQPGGVAITVRGGESALTGNMAIGDISMTVGNTYEFYIIDDGAGNVGFCIWEDGNRGNAEGVSDVISFSAATANHVVFHNREATRTSNLEEVEIGALADTDNDGMPDFWEMDNGLVVGTNDAGLDKDIDGVTNLDEFLLCLDPSDEDTDADGLLDGEENNSGTFVSLVDTGTDPLDADTDGDGLLDGVETNTGVFVDASDTGSNPFLADTDSDGTTDGGEVMVGRNPVDPSDAPQGLGIGLVAYWPFEEGSLEDVAHSSGAGSSTVADDGTFTGPATDVGFAPDGMGKFGESALMQNGAAGWVTVPKSVDTIGNDATKTVAVSLWFKANAFDTTWQTLISHGENSFWRLARNNVTNPGTIAYRGGTDDPTSTTSFATPMTDYVHVVGMSDGTTSTIFINGMAEATGNGALDTNLAAAVDLFIGNNPQALGREFNGYLDDVAIWNRTLNQADIDSIYAGGEGASIADLIGIGEVSNFRITNFSYDPASGDFSITWNSKEGDSYLIAYELGAMGLVPGQAYNATPWDVDLNDGYPADAGDSTTFNFNRNALLPEAQSAPRILFRVEKID